MYNFKTIIFCFVFYVLLASCKTNKSKYLSIDGDNEEIELQNGMKLAWEQEEEMTKDPKLGYVPRERLVAALEYNRQQIASKTNAALPVVWNALGPKNFGGRSRGMCIDLNDTSKKTVFLGSVSGGLWKTNDITAFEPIWQPINDLFVNLTITSISQDPTNTQIMYFSTGESYSSANRGLGVWKSSDGGNTWNQLSSTNNSNFYYCTKVVTSNTGVLFVSTNTGLYRSIDKGSSFTKVLGLGLGISGATNNLCHDIEFASNGDIYASLSGGTIHKSTNGGLNWGSSLNIGIAANRIDIATAPNNANYVYAICESSNAVSGIVMSNNAGASFSLKSEPVDADTGIPSTDFSRTQAWYDLIIAVDPNDFKTLLVGAVDIFKSVDSATTWQQITHWYGGFNFQNVHADQHNIIFSPTSSSIIYFLNDGGIFSTTNGTATIPTIISKNANYNTLQFYSCAMSPTSGSYNFLAGAQDNGTHKFTQPYIQNSAAVTGGDGGFCHIDQNQFQYWFSSYTYNNYYRSTDGGNTFTGVSHGSSGRFINPTDYDDDANIMYCARGSNEYLRWDNPQTGNTFTIVALAALNGQISAVKVSPNTSNRVFFATSAGNLLRVDNANTATPTSTTIATGLPVAYISCIEVETGNDNHILISYSNFGVNSIWETTNGGTSWTSVEGNLPDMPVRWILFNPSNNDQAVIATDLGVWSTDNLNNTSTVWGSSNTGLANVRVDMLQVRQSDKMIIAATHGRGLFYSGVFADPTANFVIPSNIGYKQSNIYFQNTSLNATSYLWDFGDGTTSTLANPTKQYANSGIYNVTLSINGGVSSVVKAITVLPRRGTPYFIANGGNFETATEDFAAYTINGTGWVLGNSTVSGKNGTNSGSKAWVTGLTGNYTNNSVSYLYTPMFNFTAVGTYDFSFYTKYYCEANYDGFRVEYSKDTALSWLPLGTSTSSGWYNFANMNNSTVFPSSQAFFSGSFGTSFVRQNFNVSFLSGNKNICFRFVFKSTDQVTTPGVAIDDIEITGSSNVVPLQLTNFAVSKVNNKNALINFTTAQEINVDGYILERSFNGINFSSIAKIAAKNNYTSTNNYSYVDVLSNTANIVYYKLKMLDKDGSFKYSAVQKILFDNASNNITISPNPFINKIIIGGANTINAVELLTLEGKIAYSTKSIINNFVTVPNSLAKGTYIVKVTTPTGIVSKKIVKQ